MPLVSSKDGTRIAYERHGSGPAVVLVDGALCYRGGGWTVQMAKMLSDQFTVHAYDRRGRGESGDTKPYAPEREIEDLEAVIAAAGGSVFLYGHSSGGVISLETANRNPGVRKVVVYEAPLMTDGSRALGADYEQRLNALIRAGRNADALRHFMRRGVGIPAIFVFLIQFAPFWKKLKAIAPTLANDAAITVPLQTGRPLPRDRWAKVTVPTRIVGGMKSPGWLRNAQREIAAILPNSGHSELAGQDHSLKGEAIAPLLRDFFAD
jgi:pimeloyl-ACP methyl ester carboxylesterase